MDFEVPNTIQSREYSRDSGIDGILYKSGSISTTGTSRTSAGTVRSAAWASSGSGTGGTTTVGSSLSASQLQSLNPWDLGAVLALSLLGT